ncbi:hypothetical protein [Streptomyces sp. CA-179760]|uniref:hypothetical protein n=1 Tax=Streptomyces sp. CA-179760 TaxID=3240054 RepID=UPI003D8CF872
MTPSPYDAPPDHRPQWEPLGRPVRRRTLLRLGALGGTGLALGPSPPAPDPPEPPARAPSPSA